MAYGDTVLFFVVLFLAESQNPTGSRSLIVYTVGLGQSPASTHSGSGSGFVILALLFKIGSEQLAILDGGQEEKNADKKVFHKKPGVKMIQNTSALQGRINTRGTEEQLVG